MDLQKLIDTPGYGKHVKKLKKAGQWDEWAGLPEKQFHVEVEGVIRYKIKARHYDEAINIAEDAAECDFDEILSSEAKEVAP